MKKRNGLLFVLLTFLAFQLQYLGCKQTPNLEQMKASIEKKFANTSGAFALAWKNLNTGQVLFINELDSFHAASTMKTPVMIELYKQSKAGKFKLSDSVLVKDQFYSIVDSSIFKMDINEDSESRLYSAVGKKLPISELLHEMITMSSNLATNILIDLVDAKKVTGTMRSLGAPQIKVLRGVEDLKAFEQGLSNSTTAYDLYAIFEKLALGLVVDGNSNQQMVHILLEQKFNDIIPKHLPNDVKVAHKTGNITGVHHDSGMVILPDGRKYVLVLLSKGMDDFDKGTEMLADVSKLIYDYVTRG